MKTSLTKKIEGLMEVCRYRDEQCWESGDVVTKAVCHYNDDGEDEVLPDCSYDNCPILKDEEETKCPKCGEKTIHASYRSIGDVIECTECEYQYGTEENKTKKVMRDE